MGVSNRDWIGGKSVLNCNFRSKSAEPMDYYATDPRAVELLLEREKFQQTIIEPACGEGHISEVLKRKGYTVISSDIVQRGYGMVKDFFEYENVIGADIITNPPYKHAKAFVEHAIKTCSNGSKIAMLLKLTFLEGKGRKNLFLHTPPRTVYVFSSRILCGKNGVFEGSPAVAYAWFVWEKGSYEQTNIKWID